MKSVKNETFQVEKKKKKENRKFKFKEPKSSEPF